jgi:hypothetical protein
MNDTWIEHYRAGAVTMTEFDANPNVPCFVVMDQEHWRLRFFPDLEQATVGVGIDAEWKEDRPGELANYTPSYEYNGVYGCGPGEVTISDDGLLSVMPRMKAPAHVEIRVGWTVRLPAEMVEPVRRAIALCEIRLSQWRGAGTPPIDRP